MINIGIGIGWAKAIYSVANNIIANFKARVATYPGSIFEAGPCLDTTLEELNAIGLLDNASLVVTPNAYNETKLYSVVPNTTLGDMDVVRATTATRVNELGLIEIVPRNLLTYSGDFSDASWVKAGGATIALSTIEPPFPNIQTYNLTNIGDSLKYITKDTGTIINASYSFYLKAIDASDIGKTFGFKISNSSPYLSLELTDEWQRIDVFSSTLTGNYFRLLSLGSEAATKVCIAAAQLELSPTITEYFPTTTRLNIPRIDYTNGSCPSLLVEPQRTNLLTFSEQFDDASYDKTNILITANTTNSPSGLIVADTLAGNGVNGFHAIQKTLNFTVGITYTLSFFLKKNTNNFAQLILPNASFGTNAFANFDLNTGVLGTVGAGVIALINNANNEWYRCSITFTATSTATSGISCALIDTSNSGRAQSNSLSTSVYLWGAQLEADSSATSYIPTVASTVTRNADVISKTGISSLIGQTEGTMFAEVDIQNWTSGERIFGISDGTNNNTVVLQKGTSVNTIRAISRLSNVLQVTIPSSAISGNTFKLALAYKANDFVFYVNGVQIGANTSNSVPACSDVYLGKNESPATVGILNDRINSAILWKERLSNAQLELLTGDSFYTYDKMAIALNYNIQ